MLSASSDIAKAEM